jgi:hypothetical protein
MKGAFLDKPMQQDRTKAQKSSHIPRGSMFYEKVVPVLLIAMGILMLLLVVFAAGVLTGLIKF